MIGSSLPLRSLFVLLPATAACACSRPATATTLLSLPRITLLSRRRRRRRRLAAWLPWATESSTPVDEEDEFCPVDCVTQFRTDEEFQHHLERSKTTGALVVVDFYRPSCGSCRYIEKRFIRLCKGSRSDSPPVVFLKHNVIDEYDEKSEVAERLRIKVVPLFHFYKNGELVEEFATRDKERIIAAIQKYTSVDPEPEGEPQE